MGRPAERSRAEVTAAAIALADSEGLEAVTMRRVAAAMGTGPASLYRYVLTRGELIDLMVDAVAAEYEHVPPTGDWLADIVEVARQTRGLMRRHPWLTTAMPLRPMLGPHALDLVEHVLAVLAAHPAAGATKLQAYAILNGLIGLLTRSELTGLGERRAELTIYLERVAGEGRHPQLAAAMNDTRGGADAFDTIVGRVMTALLDPAG